MVYAFGGRSYKEKKPLIESQTPNGEFGARVYKPKELCFHIQDLGRVWGGLSMPFMINHSFKFSIFFNPFSDKLSCEKAFRGFNLKEIDSANIELYRGRDNYCGYVEPYELTKRKVLWMLLYQEGKFLRKHFNIASEDVAYGKNDSNRSKGKAQDAFGTPSSDSKKTPGQSR